MDPRVKPAGDRGDRNPHFCHDSKPPMIRVLVYLVIVAVLAFGAVWFAERPGDVAITWQGRRIDTSVMVLAAAVAAVAVPPPMPWASLRPPPRAPPLASRF